MTAAAGTFVLVTLSGIISTLSGESGAYGSGDVNVGWVVKSSANSTAPVMPTRLSRTLLGLAFMFPHLKTWSKANGYV